MVIKNKIEKQYQYKDDGSLMSKEQKLELERRSTLYKQGKLKTYSWEEVVKKSKIKK